MIVLQRLKNDWLVKKNGLQTSTPATIGVLTDAQGNYICNTMELPADASNRKLFWSTVADAAQLQKQQDLWQAYLDDLDRYSKDLRDYNERKEAGTLEKGEKPPKKPTEPFAANKGRLSSGIHPLGIYRPNGTSYPNVGNQSNRRSITVLENSTALYQSLAFATGEGFDAIRSNFFNCKRQPSDNVKLKHIDCYENDIFSQEYMKRALSLCVGATPGIIRLRNVRLIKGSAPVGEGVDVYLPFNRFISALRRAIADEDNMEMYHFETLAPIDLDKLCALPHSIERNVRYDKDHPNATVIKGNIILKDSELMKKNMLLRVIADEAKLRYDESFKQPAMVPVNMATGRYQLDKMLNDVFVPVGTAQTKLADKLDVLGLIEWKKKTLTREQLLEVDSKVNRQALLDYVAQHNYGVDAVRNYRWRCYFHVGSQPKHSQGCILIGKLLDKRGNIVLSAAQLDGATWSTFASNSCEETMDVQNAILDGFKNVSDGLPTVNLLLIKNPNEADKDFGNLFEAAEEGKEWNERQTDVLRMNYGSFDFAYDILDDIADGLV